MPVTAVGSDFIVNTIVDGDQFSTSVSGLGDGRFVVAWRSGDIGAATDALYEARIYGTNGQPVGSEFTLNSTPTNSDTTYIYNLGVDLALLSTGQFVAVWSSSDEDGSGLRNVIRARLFNVDGSSSQPDFLLSQDDGRQNLPAVAALAGGGFVTSWWSSDTPYSDTLCIRARIYSGGQLQNEFVVNTTPMALGPSDITVLANGRILVTWQSGDAGDGSGASIRARLFDASGIALADDFLVNTTAVGDQWYSQVTDLQDGRFVVTWQSFDDGESSGRCIRARVFNSDGSAAGNDFIVNTTTYTDQTTPAVAAFEDGRVVFVWRSNDPFGDSSDSCIRARVFNADGTPDGQDFVVNSTGAGEQSEPDVAVLGDGRFVVSWESADGGDGSGLLVRARVFDAGTVEDKPTPGDDNLKGTPDADTIDGLAGNDVIDGLGGNDRLIGGSGNDTLKGAAGNDTLNGGLGVDIMLGGVGNDTYVVDNALDIVDERGGSGVDRVLSGVTFMLSGSFSLGAVENLTLTGKANIAGIGNGLANTIVGNAGNNTLQGLGGNDKVTGGAGNDTLNGGLGVDIMLGGVGNDTYVVDNARDIVDEKGGGGVDRVLSSVAFNLSGSFSLGAVENLTLTGKANVAGTGNGLSNTIVGNAGNNTLQGLAGNDNLDGGAGNDILSGGTGKDTLTGGAGKDAFRFVDNLAAANVDKITDFNVKDDIFQLDNAVMKALGAADASMNVELFHKSASGVAVTKDQRVIYDTNDGKLYYDADGNGDSAALLIATLSKNLALTAADFAVI